MKTYILRAPKAVEPQNPQRHPRHADPSVTALVAVICGPATTGFPAQGGPGLYVGLDVKVSVRSIYTNLSAG